MGIPQTNTSLPTSLLTTPPIPLNCHLETKNAPNASVTMSTHEKKAPRASNLRTNKSPIATPPRAALHGRSKTDHTAQQQVTPDNASTKSGREGSGTIAGGGGAETTSTSPASEAEDSAATSSTKKTARSPTSSASSR